MEPVDLTIRILQEIRDEIRRGTDSNESFQDEQRAFNEQVLAKFDQIDRRLEQGDQRFERIETAILDMAEQLVFLARGVKVTIEGRSRVDDRVDALELRVDALERSA